MRKLKKVDDLDLDDEPIPPGGDMLPERDLDFIPSGCAQLDCVLGGGWPLGRISNVVGDKSVGKTLLAIEAAHNFARLYSKGKIWYRESEAAFDTDYAEELGLPIKRVDFGPKGAGTKWNTVEDVVDDMGACMKAAAKSRAPGLYIVDSLDALSTTTRLARDMRKGTFGGDKPKLLNEMFERFARDLYDTNVHFMIVSQLRHNIGVTFGEKYTRSGGKGLDFYSSQILWLRHMKILTRTIKGNERAIGVRVHAKCKKNKIVRPFQECEFTLRFHFGVDDFGDNLAWLKDQKRLDKLGLPNGFLKRFDDDKLTEPEWREWSKKASDLVRKSWYEIDHGFRPRFHKYLD